MDLASAELRAKSRFLLAGNRVSSWAHRPLRVNGVPDGRSTASHSCVFTALRQPKLCDLAARPHQTVLPSNHTLDPKLFARVGDGVPIGTHKDATGD